MSTSAPGTASHGPDQSVRLIRTLTVTVFLQWMGATALVPMLPVYIRHLGGSDALAGVVMASFFAAGVLSQYPIGRLADRVGPAPGAGRPDWSPTGWPASRSSFPSPPPWPSPSGPCRAWAPARPRWPPWP